MSVRFTKPDHIKKARYLVNAVALHKGSIGASQPEAPGLILGHPKKFFSLDVVEIYRRPCSESLNNVDRNRLVLQAITTTNRINRQAPLYSFR